MEDIDHLRSNRFARLEELSKLSSSRRGEAYRPCARIGWMPVPLNQSVLFKQDEHGPYGAGIGRHALSEFSLGERASTGERCEKHELVGRYAIRREPCIRPAMQGQVSGTKRHREFASGRHRRIQRRSYVYARFQSVRRRQAEMQVAVGAQSNRAMKASPKACTQWSPKRVCGNRS